MKLQSGRSKSFVIKCKGSDAVFRIIVLYEAVIEFECVFKLHRRIGFAGIYEVHIIVRLFPPLRQMIDNIKYRETQICFAGTIGPVDNAILYNSVFNCGCIELITARMGQIPFNPLIESSVILYSNY